MTDNMTEPISTRNLDRYGSAELPWSRAHDVLANDTPQPDLAFFVATVRPDGRPHSAGVGATWVDDALYFTSGPGTLKSRNLAANPACTVSVRLRGIDLVLEGEAPPGHRFLHFGACGGRLPHGRLGGFGGWRRAHGAVQRAQRGPRAMAPVPPHTAHRRRRGHRRASRRYPLGLRPLGRAQLHRPAPAPGSPTAVAPDRCGPTTRTAVRPPAGRDRPRASPGPAQGEAR